MGQYMSVGIIKEIEIQKENLDQYSFEDLKTQLEKQGYHLDVFNQKIKGNQLVGTLKMEIVEAELVPFLEQVYDLLKDFTSLSDYHKVIEKAKNVTDFNAFLEEADFYDFQLDKYAHGDRIYVDRNRIKIYFTPISFKMAGKIILESDGGLFHLFTSLLQKQLSNFQLSKTLRLYTTG